MGERLYLRTMVGNPQDIEDQSRLEQNAQEHRHDNRSW